MFKLIVICTCIVGSIAAPPPSQTQTAEIVQQESDLDVGGKYHYKFATSDGTKAEQHGELKQIGNEAGATATGFYEYTDNNGTVFKVTYTADENGFVASGDHIPGIPEVIARSLKWAAEHPYKEPEQKKH
ncbi:hypothetical protein PPYR_11356 [Photinus pyralis]|uniref:Uncharacterized protein n=1 Tax=Photinus pyralis TaxID=7054 RepID=A0A1Y1KPD3_PHOPY|nr:endocuticle structural glycoprotein SgAbd-1-like [Photinus pyralis]KAB0794517.1 hypothetical protein PPYR_11356 [Photinus pyralis]